MTTGTIEGEFIATMDDPDDPEMFERNRIHTNSGAQEYGFEGAFVGGVTLYAWCIPTVIEALGEEWLDRGWVNIRFRRPTYPGAHIRVRVTPKMRVALYPQEWSAQHQWTRRLASCRRSKTTARRASSARWGSGPHPGWATCARRRSRHPVVMAPIVMACAVLMAATGRS